MTLEIHRIVTGFYKQNGYVIADQSGQALIVDPGAESERYKEIIEQRGYVGQAIIVTHAHFDHVGAVAELMDFFDIPFYLHHGDLALLKRMNLYKMIVEQGPALRVPDLPQNISECGGNLAVGKFSIEIMDAPGHTLGGVCFIIAGHIFTGDTLLPAGAGRTDLPGGDAAALEQSLALLAKRSTHLIAHPGHGPSMDLGDLLSSALRSRAAIG